MPSRLLARVQDLSSATAAADAFVEFSYLFHEVSSSKYKKADLNKLRNNYFILNINMIPSQVAMKPYAEPSVAAA
ncbi:hypothetical protein Nepgr_012364 [Nepenthes gracilis]|uniref:Uncharacterized protein n=1 Tax=Nepenthes gracilis TaxID=150966 RepID=A0AAD3SFW2_NEPGR|nr:hypothetical protein Nepgr_012364 [Nepenthes gracilis]